MSNVVITMRNGDRYYLDRRSYLDGIVQKINENRGKGKLIDFELDLTPTGQMVWVDPDLVSSVKSER